MARVDKGDKFSEKKVPGKEYFQTDDALSFEKWPKGISLKLRIIPTKRENPIKLIALTLGIRKFPLIIRVFPLIEKYHLSLEKNLMPEILLKL